MLDDGRGCIAKKVMKRQPECRKKRGRLKLTWMDGIQNLIQKGLTEEDWEDRDNWRLKIL